MRRTILAPVSLLAVLLVVLLGLLGAAIARTPASTAANLQSPPEGGNIQFQVTLPEGGLPVAPAFVRLLRITLEPGASSPLHTHPGPEFARVDSGTLTVLANGRALLTRAATEDEPAETVDAPDGEEFRMRRGDMLTYLPQTQMTFRNAGQTPVKVLSGVILPAGHQHPPGITYIGGQPAQDAFVGVTPEILGDGIATALPAGSSIVTIDRVKLEAGEPIPAFDGPILLSVTSGVFDFTVTGGRVQVSRTADPGPQADATVGTVFSLARGDAAFFPAGMAEAARGDGELQLMRMTIVPAEPAAESATPVAAADETGVIEIEIPETPAATETPEAEPTEEATEAAEPTEEPEPTATEQTGRFQEGDLVAVTDEGVNLRSGPSTDTAAVLAMEAGRQLIVTGPSETGNDLVWWPVRDANDESITGYVADQFIELVE